MKIERMGNRRSLLLPDTGHTCAERQPASYRMGKDWWLSLKIRDKERCLLSPHSATAYSVLTVIKRQEIKIIHIGNEAVVICK
jgi:hypothetical protein